MIMGVSEKYKAPKGNLQSQRRDCAFTKSSQGMPWIIHVKIQFLFCN